jgi:hypothetical protein
MQNLFNTKLNNIKIEKRFQEFCEYHKNRQTLNKIKFIEFIKKFV